MASERLEVTELFSRLHATAFKPRGFKKTRRTFTKTEGGYLWAMQFQGCSWNSLKDPWQFYLNVGIQFSGIPRRVPDRDFPMMHSSMRVNAKLSPGTDDRFEIIPAEIEVLLGRLVVVVENVSAYFSKSHTLLRDKYDARAAWYLGYLDEILMEK